ncbi:MAG: low molecular weight protein-tyrosine-phosphatase [Candidatus Howiella sp.]|jgi:protein-tyrosine phosphatase
MIKILFICHGNICRSPMAEFVMKELLRKAGRTDIQIASAATSNEEIGNDVHPGTKRRLEALGIPYTRRRAVRMTAADYGVYDLLIGMDRQNVRNILRITGGDPKGKVHLLLEYAGEPDDIADPWYTGNFTETSDDILRGCEGLLNRLSQAPPDHPTEPDRR